MTDSISMLAGVQCFTDGRPSTGAAVMLCILLLQVGFGLILRRRANFAGRRFFLIANAALAYWLLLATLEQWTLDPGCKIWFSALSHYGITLVPLAWVMFIDRYCYGKRGPMAPWQRAVLVALPLGVLAIALTSPWHGLFYAPGTGPASDVPGAPVTYVHGAVFMASSAVLYGLMAWSIWLLSRGFIAARSSFRLHFGLLLILTLAPLVANAGHVVADAALFDFDPTPFFFVFTSMAYAVIIMTNNHLDIVGIARKDFFDAFPAALMVIDTDGKLLSVNRAGAGIMTLPEVGDRIVQHVGEAALEGSAAMRARVQPLTVGGRSFRVSLHPVLSPLGREGRTIGWMATVDDVTAWQEMIAGLTATLQERSSELERSREASEQLQSLAMRDPLTGLLNRRGLENALKSLLSEGTPPATISIALIDIDHFKAVNDRYGHEAGDAVLVRFADVLQRTFRRTDLVFRVGGEEFLVLGPGLDGPTMAQRIDHARAMLAEDAKVRTVVPDGPVQFSAGLDGWTAAGTRPMSEVMRSVDALLYAAKREGRNRTAAAG